MIISYDNLIVRLWLNGAIMPHEQVTDEIDKASIETLIDDKGLPPVPHDYWVDRLGFQQPDPVTDFRSGGVLSLAMLVHIVEACPSVHERFVSPHGDASVLPFGITCINVTDMLSKFCMLAKSVDRMDALLSQKPFWRMFADPNSILALQELSLDMLADVVVELGDERRIPGYSAPDDNQSLHNDKDDPGKVRRRCCSQVQDPKR
jgi:ELMO/CED-12 family